MDLKLLEQIILVLIDTISLLLVWWVIRSSASKKISISFTLATFFMLVWINFAYLALVSPDLESSVLFYRINIASVPLFVATFFYFFVINFLGINGIAKVFGKLFLVISLILSVPTIATNWAVKEVIHRDWGNEIIIGQLHWAVIIFGVLIGCIVIPIYAAKSYKNATPETKLKIKYLFAGVIIFILANAIFNGVLVALLQSVKYQIFGDFSAIFLLGFTAYAIIKHELFNVKIITTEAITAILLVVLFTKVFAVQSTTELVIDGFTFVLALIFGYLLVRSVGREVSQREQLQQLNQKLEQIDAQKDEFLNVASHELRAPMTAIKGYISMVSDGDGGEIPPGAKELLSEATIETERMIRLVNNMLNVARIEEGRMVFEPGEVKLSQVVNRVFNEFKFQANEKSLEYEYEPKATYDVVVVDVDRIHEVVANLINNALKYTDSGKVVVRLFNPNPDTVRFEVEDTGPGMTPDEVSKLFNKFYRTESYVGKKMGTGLGLYISKLLVQKFGGQIGVKSQKDKGSIFWFELPLKK